RRRRKRGGAGPRPPHATAPVALAGQEGQAGVGARLILHPTDFSERSEFAFRIACALAREHGARLILLHVAPPPVLAGGGGSESRAEDYPERLREELHQLGVPDPSVNVEYRLEEGEPIGGILAVAEETGADLIVMGTHGRTGLGWLLMGSVAEQVVRKA